MMTLKTRVVTVGAAVIIILSTLMIAVTTNGLTNMVFAQGPPTIVMTGSEEVPPVQTEATGVAEITPGVDSIAYGMNATNIEGVTAGHIHLGAKGENGPIL